MKTAADLGREIAQGKLDPVELTEATLEKIENNAHRDSIFARLTGERARSEAEGAAARQKSDSLKSPLDGVPISWKDLFDTRNVATESGSKLLKGRVPEKDCVPLKFATDAGLVCVGKTHLSELAFSGLGINPNAATSPNIHGDNLAPGGSSSGAAASVAHELVPIGIGSDTGGSVRIPSAWNDLTGFKTTHGLISLEGSVALCSGFDTVGPLCRSMEDAWLMTSIMAGLEPVLPETKPVSECEFLVNETIMLDELGDNQREGFEIAIEALQSAGAKVTRGQIHECNDLLPLGPVLFPYEAWAEWGMEIEAQPSLMFEPVRNRFESGKGVTREQYDIAKAAMMDLRKSYNQRTSLYDAVLAPTVAIAPPEVHPLLADYELFGATNMMALRNTRFFNMLGCCALTLPTSKPASGLMVAAQGGRDRELAGIGLGIEQVLSSP
ncbi:MAG: amidase family protein [Pseudomonadota bacterium]